MEYEIESKDSVSQAVTESVSKFENIPIDELPVLFGSLDPDALNSIFMEGENVRVSFAYSNSLVGVYDGEYLTVEAA